MRRGDLVTVALQGDYGKPRPALVIQSDMFPEARSKTVLPLTSAAADAPLIRVRADPGEWPAGTVLGDDRQCLDGAS